MPAYDPQDNALVETVNHPRHVQDRLTERDYCRRQVERMQAAGRWDMAAAYITAFIDPINDWLWERGIW